MDSTIDLPAASPTDPSDVALALETAHALWRNGDSRDALKWLRRAAETAEAEGDDLRALSLARAAAELSDLLPPQQPSAPPAARPSAPAGARPSATPVARPSAPAARPSAPATDTQRGSATLPLVATVSNPNLRSRNCIWQISSSTKSLPKNPHLCRRKQRHVCRNSSAPRANKSRMACESAVASRWRETIGERRSTPSTALCRCSPRSIRQAHARRSSADFFARAHWRPPHDLTTRWRRSHVRSIC